MRLDPLVNNGSSKTGCAVRIIACQQSKRTDANGCECAPARLLRYPSRRLCCPHHATGAECCSSRCRIAVEVVLSRQVPVDKLSRN